MRTLGHREGTTLTGLGGGMEGGWVGREQQGGGEDGEG